MQAHCEFVSTRIWRGVELTRPWIDTQLSQLGIPLLLHFISSRIVSVVIIRPVIINEN